MTKYLTLVLEVESELPKLSFADKVFGCNITTMSIGDEAEARNQLEKQVEELKELVEDFSGLFCGRYANDIEEIRARARTVLGKPGGVA